MTPRGYNAEPVDAPTLDDAIALVELRGFDVLDVLDDVIVIADEPAPDLGE